jgi:hypothetical protein
MKLSDAGSFCSKPKPRNDAHKGGSGEKAQARAPKGTGTQSGLFSEDTDINGVPGSPLKQRHEPRRQRPAPYPKPDERSSFGKAIDSISDSISEMLFGTAKEQEQSRPAADFRRSRQSDNSQRTRSSKWDKMPGT